MLGVSCGLPWLQQFWAHLSAAYALLTFCVCCNTFSGSWAEHLLRMPVFWLSCFHEVHVARVQHRSPCSHEPGHCSAYFVRGMHSGISMHGHLLVSWMRLSSHPAQRR